VRHPADLSGGPYPLALLLHGNHGNCRRSSYDFSGSNPALDDACVTTNTGACPGGARPSPNAEGLAALAETLAAHGYVVASVDANAVNCRDLQRGSRPDGFIGQRAQMLVEHLRRWRSFASAEGAEPFAQAFSGHVDLGRVALFGHGQFLAVVAGRGCAAAGHAGRVVPRQSTSTSGAANGGRRESRCGEARVRDATGRESRGRRAGASGTSGTGGRGRRCGELRSEHGCRCVDPRGIRSGRAAK
jgi:hypothetical protein